jgi:hypothetical protein
MINVFLIVALLILCLIKANTNYLDSGIEKYVNLFIKKRKDLFGHYKTLDRLKISEINIGIIKRLKGE